MIYQIVVVCTIISVTFANGIGHHKPYAFGYSVKDHHGEQHRHESGDGGHAVKGSYGFTDDRGVHRQVDYVADHAGFRAQVKTNEPGTANQDPAAVKVISSAHPYFGNHAVHGGYGLGAKHGGHEYGHGVGYGGYGHGLGYAGTGGVGYGAGYGGLGHGHDTFGGHGGYGPGAYGGYGGYGHGGYGHGAHGGYGVHGHGF